MADFKALTIRPVKPGDGEDRLCTTINQIVTWINGLTFNGQVTRTGQNTFILGGGGGPPLDVPSGGTGQSSLTAHSVLIGEGTSPVGFAGPEFLGAVLASGGKSADPSWSTTPLLGSSDLGGGTLSFWDDTAGGYGGMSLDTSSFGLTSSTAVTELTIGNLAALATDASGGLLSLHKAAQIKMDGSTSGTITIQTQAAAGTFNFNLPTTAGSSGQVLTSAGGGSSQMTWSSAAPLTVGTTTITSGTSGRVLYDNAGVLGEKTTTGSGSVVLATQPDFTNYITIDGSLVLRDTGGGNAQLQTAGVFVFDATEFWCRDSTGTNIYFRVNTGTNAVTVGLNSSTATTVTGPLNIATGQLTFTNNSTAFVGPMVGLFSNTMIILGGSSGFVINDSANTFNILGSDSSGNLTMYVSARVKAGTSSSYAKIGGSLFDHFANAGNTTTTETDLYSDTTPASVLGTNGDKLTAEYGGVFVSSATATRQVRIYFAGTAILDTGALTLSLSSAWTVYVTITRVSATVVRYMVSLTTEGAALAAYTSVGELTGLTLSNTNILKITGQAAGVGAASNDIVAKLGTVSWIPAA